MHITEEVREDFSMHASKGCRGVSIPPPACTRWLYSNEVVIREGYVSMQAGLQAYVTMMQINQACM
jgi:hypothetical protein